MLTLYFFAPVVITYFGWFSFLIVYFISLVCGSLLSLKIHEKQPYYSAIGASGAITGVLYAAILLNPDAQLGLFFVFSTETEAVDAFVLVVVVWDLDVIIF